MYSVRELLVWPIPAAGSMYNIDFNKDPDLDYGSSVFFPA